MEWEGNRIKVSNIEGLEYALCLMPTPYIRPLYALPLLEYGDINTCMLMVELEYLFDSNQEGFYMPYETKKEKQNSANNDSWHEQFYLTKEQIKQAFDNIGIRYNSFEEFESETDVFKGKYYCSVFNPVRQEPYYLRNPEVDEAIKSVLLPGMTVASIYRFIEQKTETNRQKINKDIEEGDKLDGFQMIARLLNIGGGTVNEQ